MSPITRLTPIADLPDLVRVSEAATVLDVSEGTVRGLLARGELAMVRCGRLVRIPRSSLVNFVAGRVPDPSATVLAFVAANPHASVDEILRAVGGSKR